MTLEKSLNFPKPCPTCLTRLLRGSADCALETAKPMRVTGGHLSPDHYCNRITGFVRILWKGPSPLMWPVKRPPPVRPKYVGPALKERVGILQNSPASCDVTRGGGRKKKGEAKAGCLIPTPVPHTVWTSSQIAVPSQWGEWT